MINGDTSYLSVLKIVRHYIENITSFGGIYHIIDVFSKLGFERQGWQATDRYLRSNIHIPLYPHQ